jgi:hypothetical protein
MNKKTVKISLSKETLRNLDLGMATGGMPNTVAPCSGTNCSDCCTNRCTHTLCSYCCP